MDVARGCGCLLSFSCANLPNPPTKQPTYNKNIPPSILPTQEWKLSEMDETSGTAGNWPVINQQPPPPPISNGWWCTNKCLLPLSSPAGSIYGYEERRSLQTYVQALVA